MAEKFREFYDRQLAILAEKDFERLANEQYTADAELTNINDGVHVVGAPAIREHFREYVGHLGYIKIISTDKYFETDDALMFEAHIETAGGIAHVYDTFVFRDGKIWRHFAGLIGFQPKQA